MDKLAQGRGCLGGKLPPLRPIRWHRVCNLQSLMLHPLKSPAVFLLILWEAAFAASSFACGLGHCARLGVSTMERPVLGLSVDHADGVDGDARNAFTQTVMHARLPIGSNWALGGRLPLGYLQTAAAGHWGLGNPLAFAEWVARPELPQGLRASQAFSLGMQIELPVGDVESGIASDHAMIMPYAAHALRGSRFLLNASLGLAAQVSGAHHHDHGDDAESAMSAHAMHAGHSSVEAAAVEPVSAEDLAVQANPHAPYEFLYRIALALPLHGLPLEPEAGVSGARVLFAEAGDAPDYVSLEGALGIRLARAVLLKPHWEQQFTHPGRFAWKAGVDIKAEWPARAAGRGE